MCGQDITRVIKETLIEINEPEQCIYILKSQKILRTINDCSSGHMVLGADIVHVF